ncbi:MAG: ATP-binding protein, partial [Candidatus Electrothrix sp. AR3]|nr:ATP-binding protein [Candidatus Electrothrix sp. AR3]
MNSQAEWMEENDRQLTVSIARIRQQLEQLTLPAQDKKENKKKFSGFWQAEQHAVEPKLLEQEESSSPTLKLLADALGLSAFEQNILLLCAAMELDTRIAGLCAKVQGNTNKPYPTFALALILFPDPDWQSLSPRNPLRHWRLLEIHQPGIQPLTGAALTADERIVNFLKGINYLDDRLTAVVEPMGRQQLDNGLPPSQQEDVASIVQGLQAASEKTPVIELLGHDTASKELIAGQAAAALGLNL